ncbi:DNA primase large subunit [Sistotremastrum niveocremeum HHB9708]|uniref:DNA primase large subunit n=2 Tax=Sistotremastraceae TaxID=3402574 RepID=A0A165AID5_9AGAM|nr:DNA primase large subunit [Sistotremastrum niveocremeum HHB9708]KZT44073.1 DNA primase, large subunit [Sistotremastrum suecicum HHB10207 ss-3]
MFSTRDRKPLDQRTDSHFGQVDDLAYLKYRHRLNFYDEPPLFDVTLEEFETWAIDRLRILAEIESSAARNRTLEELKSVTTAQCNKYLPLNSNSAIGIDRDSERKKDHVSHFVLRLAFCRSEELRARFVKAETTLFRIRYELDDTQERETFLSTRDFGWKAVDEEEREKYSKELRNASSTTKEVPGERYYKVHWTKVPDLIEKRRVFLKEGYAYVPSREQSSIVFQAFQNHLNAALQMTARALPRLEEDTRVLPILNHLSQGFLSGVPSEYADPNFEANGEEITAEMVDDLSRKHFPMCMRNLHDNLRKDHHLKHYGRLQYGLFLKVLGLSINEALVFWRQSFGASITEDKFNKEYRYNIRHSYGLEGKRANYPAKSCQRILTNDQPGPQDSHGCPYRHFSVDNLQAALLSTYGSQGFTSADMPEILHAVNGGHYHVACTRVFEITHGIPKGQGMGDGESVTHPNRYAARSRELWKEKHAPKDDQMIVD